MTVVDETTLPRLDYKKITPYVFEALIRVGDD